MDVFQICCLDKDVHWHYQTCHFVPYREALLLKIDQKLEEAIGTNFESIHRQLKSHKQLLSKLIETQKELEGRLANAKQLQSGTLRDDVDDSSDDDMGFGLFD